MASPFLPSRKKRVFYFRMSQFCKCISKAGVFISSISYSSIIFDLAIKLISKKTNLKIKL
jgi:hypothetical protein